MGNFYNFLAQTFGPLIQLIYFLLWSSLIAWGVGAVSFFGERRLLKSKISVLGTFPIIISVMGVLYGTLRFSGLLLYSTDGWDQWGHWNYTNQNSGIYTVFIFGCLLTGAILAVCKEKAFLKGK